MNKSSDLLIKMCDANVCARSLPHTLKPPCAIPGEALVGVRMHDAEIGPSRRRARLETPDVPHMVTVAIKRHRLATGRRVEPERISIRSQVSGHGERDLTGVPPPLRALIADVGATFPCFTTMQAGVSDFCRCDDLPNDRGVRTGEVPKEVVTARAHAAQESAKEFGQQEFGEVFPDGCQAV